VNCPCKYYCWISWSSSVWGFGRVILLSAPVIFEADKGT